MKADRPNDADLILSIVIPFYSTVENDRSAMLSDLLDSIPNRSDLEIIVVDDLSRPPCTLPSRHQRAGIVLTETPRRSLYAGAARNHGLSMAKGAYIMSADSDDLFETEGLNAFVDKLYEDRNDIFTVHLGVMRKFDGVTCGTPLYSRLTEPSALADPTRALCKWHSPCGKAFPRRALEHGLRFKEDHIVDDTTFSMNLAILADEAVFHDAPLYLIRRNHGADTLTQRSDPDAIRSRINAYREANAMLSAAGRSDLVTPMAIPCYEFARRSPLLAFGELLRSVCRGEKILPRKLRTSSGR